ncbi:MAG: 2-dehydropantoate 2-reductase N-terminal domain-containing protein [Pseudomonadota bacterium]
MAKYLIYGAGGIGGVIGHRLARAGCEVTLIARGEHAAVMKTQGLRVVDWQGSSVQQLRVEQHPRDVAIDDETFVLMCMKSQHHESALQDLSKVATPETRVVCVQNGVANERTALRYFEHVIATVVNLPTSFLTPGEVVTYAKGSEGILDSGCYPSGLDAHARQYCADLEQAGFRAVPDDQVMRKKYAKLLMNLGNVFQALVTHPRSEFAVELQRAARREALQAFSAAGIDCADRGEIADANEDVFETVDVPGYPRTGGSSWQSLARGTGDIETEFLNGEIALLARLQGLTAPVNALMVALSRQVIATGTGPQSLDEAALRRAYEGAAR